MNVLVDTPIWSLALRRRPADLSQFESTLVTSLAVLIRTRRAQILGPVRQELLSGIREEEQFRRIRGDLREFPDSELLMGDYEEAARMSNACRRKGIVGSPIDLLLCAVAFRCKWQIFTTDRDFDLYRGVFDIDLFTA
jgi:predicted nucleic acid-binding protein